jgi:cytochrome c oxidase cbb3-type subunit II
VSDHPIDPGASGPAGPPPLPSRWRRRPGERMVMTPLMSSIGAMIAFAAVVFIVVLLPVQTFNPKASEDWVPLSDAALAGRQVFLSNGCVYCHSGFSRPQDVRAGLYYLYPKVSLPGDYFGTDQTPNLLGTERTGPDLTNEGGFHPDDWQFAHFYNPRYVDPFSLMPSFKFLSDNQVNDLTSFVQERSGKVGLLRYAGTLYAKHVDLAAQVYKPAPTGFQGANRTTEQADQQGEPADVIGGNILPQPDVVNLNEADRSYWLANDPLPVTVANLLRGKEIFRERCVACHGSLGDGKGPAAKFMSPPPADFTDKDDQCCGADTSPGDFYYRVLRGFPGTAMENFGTRLSVDDIWRVVMFAKTIPNGTLKSGRIPTPQDYIQWTPQDDLKAYVKAHPIDEMAPFTERPAPTDPFMVEAERMFPGMAPGDSILVPNIGRIDLDSIAAGIRRIYFNLLNKAWADAKRRGETLPPESQKNALPEPIETGS